MAQGGAVPLRVASTSSAGGVSEDYTQDVFGSVYRISFKTGAGVTAGSVFMTVSGTGETVLQLIAGVSGTVAQTYYPREPIHSTDGTVVVKSGADWQKIPIYGQPLRLVFSGLGNAKSLTTDIFLTN